MSLERRINNIMSASKIPLTNSFHVGVEMEFFNMLDRRSLAIELLKLKYDKYLQLGYDASIQVPEPWYFKHELRICAPKQIIFKIIKDVSDLLIRLNSKVNRSCGLHVHLDMRYRNKGIIFNNLVMSQNVLFKLVDRTRQRNDYCKRVQYKYKNTFDRLRDHLPYIQYERVPSITSHCVLPEWTVNVGHYRAINARAYFKYKTIEVRLHEGTVDYKQINNWIRTLIQITNKKTKITSIIKKDKEFIKTFKLNKTTASYVTRHY